jgi:nucleotide-binding universal stress UspA family protein
MMPTWFEGPVMAAIDLQAGGDEAVRQAHALAEREGQPLHVCFVLPEPLRVRALFPHLHQADTDDLLALERQAADQVAQRVGQLTGRSGGRYAVEIDAGSPHGGILRQADRAGAGLIVVGAGATAARVVRGASVPVLVARPSLAGRVLAATDFSDPSLPALAAAAAEARRRGVPLTLLHSLHVPLAAYSGGVTGFVFPSVTPALMEDARAALRAKLQAFAQRAGTDAECLIEDGPPAAAILDAAKTLPAGLVVVGTHGRTALARIALGSVAEAVLSAAPCSVLVIRFGS